MSRGAKNPTFKILLLHEDELSIIEDYISDKLNSKLEKSTAEKLLRLISKQKKFSFFHWVARDFISSAKFIMKKTSYASRKKQ